MDEITLPLERKVIVLVASQAARPAMLDLTARLAPAGSVRVLDGGNHFNAYTVARAIRRRTPAMTEALNNIRLARAFTCYQMLALLADSPAGVAPTLVLDLLCTFYDETVPLFECRRLLETALVHLQRLARRGPVVVSTRPPAQACLERMELIEVMQAALPVYFIVPEELPEPVLQPALFAWT